MENVVPLLKRKETNTKNDINTSKFKILTVQIKHEHLERKLNPNLISNFA
jgi:hypothetical protein